MSDRVFALGMIGLALVLSGFLAFLAVMVGGEHKGSYTIQCAVITPNGPVPTVNLKAKDVVITDFGIVKSKEGIYIPTTNEVCVVTKESE